MVRLISLHNNVGQSFLYFLFSGYRLLKHNKSSSSFDPSSALFKYGKEFMVRELTMFFTIMEWKQPVFMSFGRTFLVYAKTIGVPASFQFHPKCWNPSYSADCAKLVRYWLTRTRLLIKSWTYWSHIHPPPSVKTLLHLFEVNNRFFTLLPLSIC